MKDRIGQQLGSYRIVRYLNQGGFAEVYLGEHVHLKNRQVAIKILHANKQLAKDDLEQFLTEANNIASLQHSHIVKIWDFDIEEETNTPYLVMEYAPNGTLRQQYPKGTIVPLVNILSYVKQVAEAAQYAHNHKLIHRDIKPENILLTSDNNVLLSDFGIAVTAHSTTSQITENLAGTLNYMAPEQLQGKPRLASDQYSLGVVVYEWLSGTLPFDNPFQRMLNPPAPLHIKVPSIYPAIADVVMKALAKEPQDRFETIEDFSRALEQAALAQESTILPLQSSNSTELESLSSTQPANIVPVGTVLHTFHCSSRTVSWSPDSSCIAFGSETDGIVYVWNVFEEREICKHKGHSGVNAVTWASDGNTIFSAGNEGTIQQWDIKTNRRVPLFRRHSDYVVALALSPNGKYIASGSGDQKVFVWETATAKKILELNGNTSTVSAISWSPRGNMIAFCDDKAVHVWDVTNRQEMYTYYQATDNVAWSPNGSSIASAKQHQEISVWDPNTGIPLSKYGSFLNSATSAFAWSPDGKYIASGHFEKEGDRSYVGKSIHIWEVVNGNKLFSCDGHSNGVRAIAWSPNGKYIASCSWDGTVQIWQAT